MVALDHIQKVLDYYRKFIPVNFSEERDTFFTKVGRGGSYNPLFVYQDPLGAGDYREIGRTLKSNLGSDPLVDRFLEVYIRLTDLYTAWKDDAYETVSAIGEELFGSTKILDAAGAVRVYHEIQNRDQEPGQRLDHRQIGAGFQREFAARGLKGWRVEFKRAVGGNVSIYETEKKVVIRTGAKDSRIGLESVICHELDGHLQQALNAMADTRYGPWLLSYLGTERQYEGYATFVEINNLTVPHINSEVEKGILLMLATAVAEQASFFDTYREIVGLCQDRDFSFMAAVKAKRGFRQTVRPGCFQKEYSYMLGAWDVIRLVEEDRSNYFRLSRGCFPLSALPFVSAEKPMWTGVSGFNRANWQYFKDLMLQITIARY